MTDQHHGRTAAGTGEVRHGDPNGPGRVSRATAAGLATAVGLDEASGPVEDAVTVIRSQLGLPPPDTS